MRGRVKVRSEREAETGNGRGGQGKERCYEEAKGKGDKEGG